ncbi:MAG: hypothetical protein AB1465_06400 [Patescibacteria group bacterium]
MSPETARSVTSVISVGETLSSVMSKEALAGAARNKNRIAMAKRAPTNKISFFIDVMLFELVPSYSSFTLR